jgi:MoaA/NifB/PqqE/SkfB family radical SAM enzyme
MSKDETPRMIEIGATCNNNCLFCCQYELRKQKDKKTTQIKKEMDLAKRDGKGKISFLGGEFTIRPDAIEIISYAKKLGFEYIHITTNGRMFSYDSFAKKILSAGLTVANFSVYGPNAGVHDSLTRVKGSFNQTVSGLKNYLKYESRVAASITLVKGNYRHLLDTIKMLESMGLGLFHINGPIPEGLAKKNFSKVVPQYRIFIPYLTQAVDYCKKNNMFVRVTNIPLCHFADYKEYLDEVCSQPISVMTDDGKVITEDEKRKMMKVKISKCKNCSHDSICEGVFKEYLKHYGDKEFKTLKTSLN